MSTSKTDLQLKQDIEAELRWDPKINAAQIGVTVEDGAVALMGAVGTFAEKWAAEDAAKRVAGVRTLAQDVTVKLTNGHKRTDAELASALLNAFEWDVYVPSTVSAKVEDGGVTLTGQVTWNYQREAAERATRNLMGVVTVENLIAIAPQASVARVSEQVDAALQRQATADGKAIHIETVGGKVTLSGRVSTWHATKDAARAAWSAPGVTQVVDHLTVGTN